MKASEIPWPTSRWSDTVYLAVSVYTPHPGPWHGTHKFEVYPAAVAGDVWVAPTTPIRLPQGSGCQLMKLTEFKKMVDEVGGTYCAYRVCSSEQEEENA